MSLEPAGGGGSLPPGDLVLVDTSNVSYLKGTWEGYLQALGTLRTNAGHAVPSTATWQGDRADAFRSWCDKAGRDLDQLNQAMQGVVDSLNQFLGYAQGINSQMASAARTIKENVTGYWVGSDNSVGGQFMVQSHPCPLTVKGATISGVYVDASLRPSWLIAVQNILFGAERDFLTSSALADQTLATALAKFKNLQQFGHLGRSSRRGSNPLGDPTWVALTGGGIIRPSAPGFIVNPFGTQLMPEWYDPTTAQTISNFIGDHEWVVDFAAILLAFVPGGAAAATEIEVFVHGLKLTIDAAGGNLKDVPWDAIDLGLDFTGAQKVAENIVNQLIYLPKHAVTKRVSPAVAGKVTSFVQTRMREAVQAATVGSDGKARVSASTIAGISAEASAQLSVLEAAGVPG